MFYSHSSALCTSHVQYRDVVTANFHKVITWFAKAFGSQKVDLYPFVAFEEYIKIKVCVRGFSFKKWTGLKGIITF